MSPEQELEHHRRQDRKAYISSISVAFANSIYQTTPDMNVGQIANRAFDLAEAMAVVRTERGYLPGGE